MLLQGSECDTRSIACTFVRQFFVALLYPLAEEIKIFERGFLMQTQEMFGKLMEISPIVWGIIGAIIVLFVAVLIVTGNKRVTSSSALTTKKLVYGGMCIAIAFILSAVKLYQMPQGGSITLASMFPIILYSLVFGPVAGIIAGIAYGFLQLIQDAWVLNWAQLILDYPLAYGFLGLAGLAPSFVKNIKVRVFIAVSIAILGRGLMHFLSGFIFFADSAPEGQSPVIYSLIYNGSYIIPELIITTILSIVLVSTPIYMTLKKNAAKSLG